MFAVRLSDKPIQDGVLIRGGKVLPEAVEAMKLLNGENEFGIKVHVIWPYIWNRICINMFI
jgi:hypothetical protein